MLDNQENFWYIAEELTARQREKEDIEHAKSCITRNERCNNTGGGNADENLALQREQANIAKQEKTREKE